MHVYKAKQYRCNRLFDAELSSKMTKPILLKNIFHLTLIIISIYRRSQLCLRCIDVCVDVLMYCRVLVLYVLCIHSTAVMYCTVLDGIIRYLNGWYYMV